MKDGTKGRMKPSKLRKERKKKEAFGAPRQCKPLGMGK
jgi:hypothetical protein